MKKNFTRGIAALLCALLLLGLLPAVASAADHVLKVGVKASISFGVMLEEDFSYSLTGSVPGMELQHRDSKLILAGSPTQAGEYTVTLECTGPDGTKTNVTITVLVEEASATEPSTEPTTEPSTEPSGPAPTVTKNPTDESVVEGEGAVFIARADDVTKYIWELQTAEGETILCEKLPDNVQMVRVSGSDTDTLKLTNIPFALNGSKVRCRFVGENGSSYSAYALLTVIDGEAVPKITKDPTGETVNEDGMAQFVARADNAVEYKWMLESPDGRSSYPCDDVRGIFPEIRVTGEDTESLAIFNIPASMDGWKVYCVFTAPGGDARSAKAPIRVNAKPTEPTEPEPTETEPPTTEATQPPTTQPTTEAATQPTTEAEEYFQPMEEEPERRPSNRGGQVKAVLFGLLFGSGFAIVAVLGVVIWLRLRRRDEEEEYEEYVEPDPIKPIRAPRYSTPEYSESDFEAEFGAADYNGEQESPSQYYAPDQQYAEGQDYAPDQQYTEGQYYDPDQQ